MRVHGKKSSELSVYYGSKDSEQSEVHKTCLKCPVKGVFQEKPSIIDSRNSIMDESRVASHFGEDEDVSKEMTRWLCQQPETVDAGFQELVNR